MPKTLAQLSNYPRTQVLLKVAYDGKGLQGMAYNGPTSPTIERFLLEALIKASVVPSDLPVLKELSFSRCGRTDAGVSASGNYVSIAIYRKPDSKQNLAFVLNSLLPPAVRVLSWAPVPAGFSARSDCVRRVYRYAFFCEDFDAERIAKGCSRLIGVHDFRNFCRIDLSSCRTFVREIYSCDIVDTEISEIKEIKVEASGFLRNQVRYIVTVLFSVGKGLEEPSVVDFLLDIGKCPSKPTFNPAPPEPLRLDECYFNTKVDLMPPFDCEISARSFLSQSKARRRENLVELNLSNSLYSQTKLIAKKLKCGGTSSSSQGETPKATEYRYLFSTKKYENIENRPKGETLDQKLRKFHLKSKNGNKKD